MRVLGHIDIGGEIQEASRFDTIKGQLYSHVQRQMDVVSEKAHQKKIVVLARKNDSSSSWVPFGSTCKECEYQCYYEEYIRDPFQALRRQP